MITYFEKKAVLSNADQLAENFVAYNESLSPVVLKLLINSLRKIPTTIPLNINEINENDLADPSVVKSIYTEIIKYMATISVDEQQGEIIYKTGDLARIFGVSQTTINNWIKEGRFSKVERDGKNKHAKIPESSIWTANNGQQKTIKQIAEEYALEKNKITEKEEKTLLQKEVKFFEEKYQTSYEALKNKENKSEEEEEDLEIWGYLLHRLGSLLN
jgi:hypothetical protein